MANFDVDRFPHDDMKYRLGCFSLHVKDGARIVTIVLLLLMILRIGLHAYKVMRSQESQIMTDITYASEIVTIALMMIGIERNRRFFLLPQLIILVLQEMSCIFAVLAFALAVIVKIENNPRFYTIFIEGGCMIILPLYPFLIYVIYRCYGYQNDLAIYSKKTIFSMQAVQR